LSHCNNESTQTSANPKRIAIEHLAHRKVSLQKLKRNEDIVNSQLSKNKK